MTIKFRQVKRNENMGGNIFPKKYLYTCQNNMNVFWMYIHEDGCPVRMMTCLEVWCCGEGGGLISFSLCSFSQVDEVTQIFYYNMGEG